ncbi:peptidase [Asticcacaulis sp. EMRT-3]|uniref:peptidase n=1 Tax=Asticcacaulis sp. EMRT-3 TaxID=3040349 RepID=UPI0024AF3D97|nr:peptidase [Asticcacaulis sp. EMRT-3]MDI7776171.1 peptidase [Asticcacaulis sp. EMRT-3]
MKLDWLFYGCGVIALVVIPGRWHETSNAPPAPPPPGIGEMALFANFTPFAATSIINLPVDDTKVMTGTAFSISKTGEWIVARDSIRQCSHPFLNIGGNLGVPFTVRPIANMDNYVIAVTEGAGRPLPLDHPKDVTTGMRVFMPGFPGGEVGEATARLIGQTVIEHSKRFEHNETVLAWAKAGQTEGLKGDLNQLLGAPAIDATSRVVGITLKEAPRRGRIYTSTTQTVQAIGNPPDRVPDYESEAIVTKNNYGIIADTLRREYRVAQVGCIKS